MLAHTSNNRRNLAVSAPPDDLCTLFAESPESLSRIIQGLMTGIGFIGGGAILKHGASVRGTATAASIWNTGAIGAAVALGRYEIAIVLSLINFLTLRWLTPIKRELRHGSRAAGEGGPEEQRLT